MVYIILWLLVGYYLGFVCVHSIVQDELKLFSWERYEGNRLIYVVLPLVLSLFGPLTIMHVLRVQVDWKLHWNIFKWVKR